MRPETANSRTGWVSPSASVTAACGAWYGFGAAIYFLVGVNSIGPVSSSLNFSSLAAGWAAAGAAGLAAGAAAFAAGAAGAAGLGAAAGAAGFAAGAAGLAGVWCGAAAMPLSAAFCALAHSSHMNLPVRCLVALRSATACLLHRAISQLAHFATAAWPQGCFFSSPTSTAQVSIPCSL